MKALFLFVLLSVLMLACKKEAFDEQTFIVADHKVSCTGEGTFECLLVKEKGSDNWQFFYSPIEGFNYQAGFEYVIEVKIFNVPNPPADASSKRYVLKRIISKQ